jgi:tagatose 1,6-diphosphate aldolase
MLSAGAGMEDFLHVLDHAYRAGASGYLAGRAIWSKPFEAYPDWDRIRQGLRELSGPYMARLNALTDSQAMPWDAHSCYGGSVGVANAEGSFRHHYRSM